MIIDQSPDIMSFEWSQFEQPEFSNHDTRQSMVNTYETSTPSSTCTTPKSTRAEDNKGKIDPFFEQPTSIADIEPTLKLTSNDPCQSPLANNESAAQPRCDICDKRFVNHHEYSIHCKIHQKTSNDYKCEKCGKILAGKRTLKSHRKISISQSE